MEEGEEEEEESPKELEPELEEMVMAGERLGFCAIGFERKKEFCREEEPIRGKIE